MVARRATHKPPGSLSLPAGHLKQATGLAGFPLFVLELIGALAAHPVEVIAGPGVLIPTVMAVWAEPGRGGPTLASSTDPPREGTVHVDRMPDRSWTSDRLARDHPLMSRQPGG